MEQENIEKQLFELEVLKSIFSNSNELSVEDEEAVLELQAFLSSPDDKSLLQRKLGFVIRFNADIKEREDEDFYQLPLEIVCRLPTLYPLQSHPEVLVRCLSRNLTRSFSEELSNFVISSHENDCSIMNIIEWIKDNVHRFLTSSKQNGSPTNSTHDLSTTSLNNLSGKNTFSRMFIYSHHIYSVNKRKRIVNWAKELDLNGFSMPGKPGIICVEGISGNVQEYWARLRTVPWQRLQIKETQKYDLEPNKPNMHQKFENFEEKIFSPNNDSNLDLGLLFAFLKEKDLAHIFQLYFGVDGKLPNN